MVLAMALPMILSNISTPLLGLVDTAVLGHLATEHFLAAVALGGVIFNFIFWGFGFLRMGTTAISVQAYGSGNQDEALLVLLRAIMIALFLAVLLVLLRQPIANLSFTLLNSSEVVENYALEYFDIRIFSAPASLCSYALMGWFIGQQNVKFPLLIVVCSNLINIILDIWLVYYCRMQVTGVALATVTAEYSGLLLGLILALRMIKREKLSFSLVSLFDLQCFKAMLLINSHLFIRTWCVLFAFAFFTAQAAKMGALVLAVNTLLLNFQNFLSYAQDGFAHAAEALIGKAVAAKDRIKLRQAFFTAGLWSLLTALSFTLVYVVFAQDIIALLTSLETVRLMAAEYLPWILIMPLVSFSCFFLDGVFIAAMLTREMRNTMLLSLLCVFLPVWYHSQQLENNGLWLALVAFMLARSLTMIWVIKNKALLEKF